MKKMRFSAGAAAVLLAFAFCGCVCGAEGEEELREGPWIGSIHRISEEEKTIEDFEIPGKEEALEDFDLEREIPSSMFLNVPEILQKPVLPTGCEAVSLTMALRYEGFDVDEVALADEFLIYNNETDNMAIGYVGDPFSEEGAGCFPPALAATAQRFFEDQGADYKAYNITGTSFEDLFAYVASGTPVLVWATMYMEEPEFTKEDAEYDGHTYYWYRQEHCVVLSGYDLETQTVCINDPLEGIVTRSVDEFSRIYTKTGENAVVIRQTGDSTETWENSGTEDSLEAWESFGTEENSETWGSSVTEENSETWENSGAEDTGTESGTGSSTFYTEAGVS